MAEKVPCAACGRQFNAISARCPFCNALARPGAAPAAPTRIDYPAIAEQWIAANRPLLALEFHPAAAKALDAFFDLTWGTVGKAPDDDGWQPTPGQWNVIIGFGAFFGELMRREFGGDWQPDPAAPDNPYRSRVVLRGGTEVFTIAKIHKRIKNGAAESLEQLYLLVKRTVGAAAAPAEIPGWLRQAKHFEGVGRPDLAAGFYERALLLGPAPSERLEIERLRAAARELAGRLESEAPVEAAAAEERDPSAAPPPPPAPPVPAPPAAKTPAEVLAEIEGIEDVGLAVEAYARFTIDHPEVAEPWRERGVGLTLLGRGEEALPCFDRAAALEPAEPKSYDHKAITLARLGRHEEAIRTLDEGLGHCPGSGTLHMRRGVFLTTLGRTEEAMRSFDEAIRVAPRYAETWAFKGDLEVRLGRTGDAIASLRRYLAMNPTENQRRVLAARRQLQALEAVEHPAPGSL